MKIAVIGTGAMGSIYAARLAEGGHDVVAVDTWTDHIDAIRENGLRVDGPAGTLVAAGIEATTDMAAARDRDLYVVATKASGVASAAASIAEIMADRSIVLTIQNGLGAGERIARHLPADRILLGVAQGFGASIVAPGHVHHSSMKLIRIGEMAGGPSDRLEAVAGVWRDGGFEVATYENIEQLIWEKFLCNVTLSAPCTVFDCTANELLERPDRWAVALGCAGEAWAVGRALGIDFSFEDPVAYVTDFAHAVGSSRPSMLLDHMARRRSELDAINGRVPELGRELGIPTPYNETLCAIIRGWEESF